MVVIFFIMLLKFNLLLGIIKIKRLLEVLGFYFMVILWLMNELLVCKWFLVVIFML